MNNDQITFLTSMAIITVLLLGLSVAIITDNRYDAKVLQTAIEHNCSIVTYSQKTTITCPVSKDQLKLQALVDE